jgi:hypothetical protein
MESRLPLPRGSTLVFGAYCSRVTGYPDITRQGGDNVRVADNTPAIQVLSSIGKVCGPMRLDPEQLAVRYYYDDLQY